MTLLSIMESLPTTITWRNPLKESLLDLETLLQLGAVQPKKDANSEALMF